MRWEGKVNWEGIRGFGRRKAKGWKQGKNRKRSDGKMGDREREGRRRNGLGRSERKGRNGEK